MSFVEKVAAAAQDVVELVQLRTRVDADEKQLADLQVEVLSLKSAVNDLKAELAARNSDNTSRPA